MKVWSKQEYYDEIVRRVKEDLLPAMDENGSCQYREDKTAACFRRCLIGILIPDHDYKPDLEGYSLAVLSRNNLLESVEGLSIIDYARLQNIHDRLASRWDKKLFMKELNAFPGFAEIQKIQPEEALS